MASQKLTADWRVWEAKELLLTTAEQPRAAHNLKQDEKNLEMPHLHKPCEKNYSKQLKKQGW